MSNGDGGTPVSPSLSNMVGGLLVTMVLFAK